MFGQKLFSMSLMAVLGAVNVGCIVSKSDSTQDSRTEDVKKQDNVAAQSIDRDYISGYDDHYDHGGGYGLGAHTSYGLPEGYGESFGGYEGGKHHGHHHEDHHHHHGHHHKHDYEYKKALAIKGLLVPLAGVALLGAAAAFISNPILLQLGVISGTPLGKYIGRKKRETREKSNIPEEAQITQENQIRLNEIKLLERFMTQVPKEEILSQEKKILASYLSCTGATTTGNLCLERLACEFHSPESLGMPTEAKVFKIVLDEILDNDFVPTEKKTRILNAIQKGKTDSKCFVFKCDTLENRIVFNSNLSNNPQKQNKKVIFETEEIVVSDGLPR